MSKKLILENRKKSNLAIIAGTNNAVKCSGGNSESPSHRYTKFNIACFCWDNNLEFATEATFRNNGRSDIVIKDWNLAIEILGTESVRDFMKKDYPMPKIAVRAENSTYEIEKILEDLITTNGQEWEYYYNQIIKGAK